MLFYARLIHTTMHTLLQLWIMLDLVIYAINELTTGVLQFLQNQQYVIKQKHPPIKNAVCHRWYLRLVCHGLCLPQILCVLPTLPVVTDLAIYNHFIPASRGCREFQKRTRRVTVLLSLTATQMNALAAQTVQAWTTSLTSFLVIIKDGLPDSLRLPLQHHHPLPRLLLPSQGIRGYVTQVLILQKLAVPPDIVTCQWEEKSK